MARIYSWRLTKQDYAYLYIPNSNEHISKRITDIEKIDAIVDVVSKLSKTEYRTYFDAMNNSINNYLGVRIPWDEAFCDETTAISNKVIYNSDTGKMDEIRDDILADLTEDIAEFKEEMVQKYNVFKQENEERLLTVLNNARDNFQNALNTLSGISGTVQSIINEKSAIFDQASQVLKLDSQGINASSLQRMFSENTEIKRWKDEYSGGLRTLINDYNTYAVTDKNFNKNNGIFVGLKERINSAETAVSLFKDEATAEIKKTLSAETESLISKTSTLIENNLDNKISSTITDRFNKLNIEDKIGQVITTNYGDIDGKFGDLTSRINSLSDDFGSWSGSVDGKIDKKLNDHDFSGVIEGVVGNRFSELNSRIDGLGSISGDSRVDGIIGRLDSIDSELGSWQNKLNSLEESANSLTQGLNDISTNFRKRLDDLDGTISGWSSNLGERIENKLNDDNFFNTVIGNRFDARFSGITENINTLRNDCNLLNKYKEDSEEEIQRITGEFSGITSRFDLLNGKVTENETNIGIIRQNFEQSANTWNTEINAIKSNHNLLNNKFGAFSGTTNESISNINGKLTTAENNITRINDQVDKIGTRCTNLENSGKSWNTRLSSAEADITKISSDFTKIEESANTWNSNFISLGNRITATENSIKQFSGITFWDSGNTPSIPLNSSINSVGFEYRTSTGYEIVVDDETIRLKSDKAQIIIKDDGIHLDGDVFINGVKI